MRKKLFPILLAVCMAFNITSPVYASEPGDTNAVNETVSYNERRNPEQLSANEIVTELYANDKNAMIKDAAITEAMLLTGEKEIVTDKYGIFVGRYDIPVWPSAASPLGDIPHITYLLYPHNGDPEYALYAPVTEVPDATKLQENRAAINMLYTTAWDIKEATASMNDQDKVAYIVNWLYSSLGRQVHVQKSPASCLFLKVSDCDGFSGLFHILATFCGLETKQVAGLLGTERHAWNMVKINDEWFYVDCTRKRILMTEAELISYGYQTELISGDKADVLSSNTTFIVPKTH